MIATEVLTLFLDAETYNFLAVLFFTGINKLVEDGYCHGKSTLIISQYFQNVKVVPQPIVRNLEEYLSKKFDSRLNPETVVQSVL